MRLSVRIGAVEFKGLTDKGFLITPDGFKGWDDSTPTKRQKVDRPWAHGAFGIRGFRDSRIVTLAGYCFADSEQQLDWYGSQLTGLLADGDVGQIVVEHSGKTTWTQCYVDDEPQFDVIASGAAATYELKLWCPNPRKFGNTNTPPAAATVTSYHYGNFPATSVITVSGSMSGYTIAGPTGKLYTVTQPVVAGHPHVIDMATGLLSIDGAYVTGVVSRGDTWAVPPGAQVVQTLTPLSGSGVMSVSTLDTYI
jgi:hypothetical protein